MNDQLTAEERTIDLTAGEVVDAAARTVTRYWWLPVLVGVLWIIYGMVVLSATTTSVTAIAALLGVGLIVGGASELAVAVAVDTGKWIHLAFALTSVLAGIVALAWPGTTVVVLAAVLGWYLMFSGVFTAVIAISTRDDYDLWWLSLLVGLAEVALAIWAIGYTGRSISLLIVWVGIGLIARGLTGIVAGLTLHGADRQFQRFANARTI